MKFKHIPFVYEHILIKTKMQEKETYELGTYLYFY